jgi:hypothetical protein
MVYANTEGVAEEEKSAKKTEVYTEKKSQKRLFLLKPETSGISKRKE